MVLRDQEILSLCQARDQRAIAALAEKYGAYCHTVAHNILGDHPDAEECVNDAYLAVWNGVPNAPPRSLLAYLAKVTRNIALKRLEHNQAQKRGICCWMNWRRYCRERTPWRTRWPSGS